MRKVLDQYIVGALQYIVKTGWFDLLPNLRTDNFFHNQKYVLLCYALAEIHKYKFLNQAESKSFTWRTSFEALPGSLPHSRLTPSESEVDKNK